MGVNDDSVLLTDLYQLTMLQARSYPAACTLLIDTYDTEAAARAVVHLAHRLALEGIAIQAVRLDSGDLGASTPRGLWPATRLRSKATPSPGSRFSNP